MDPNPDNQGSVQSTDWGSSPFNFKTCQVNTTFVTSLHDLRFYKNDYGNWIELLKGIECYWDLFEFIRIFQIFIRIILAIRIIRVIRVIIRVCFE